jgi:2-polyprenyl-3-methyl-5-hydroxy-6-metoxy-1,4-benzoquinol methylase
MTPDRQERIAELNFDYDAQEKEYLSHCNVCGSEKLTQLTHTDRYGYNAGVTACSSCSTTFLNPRMTAERYTDFYISQYRPLVSAYHGRLIDAVTVQVDQKDYTKKLVDTLKPFIDKKNYKTLLDVGGSTGIVALGLMEVYGLKTTLIDPAPDEVKEAKQLGIESVTAFVEEWDPQGKKYDIVGMFQTIDHLLDAKGTFDKLRTVIEDDGLLVVDIVDFRTAFLRHWNINEGTKIDHPYYFTEISADTLFVKTGFEPIQKIVSEDRLHVLYVCRPTAPNPVYLPEQHDVKEYLKEVRFVQSTPWKKG